MDKFIQFKTNLEPIRRTGTFFIDEEIPIKSRKISTRARERGNKIYRSENHDYMAHTAILVYYSKSLASAPNNSEEVALAYGNRSAFWFHLKKYRECLIDIERGYQITCSEELRDKLLCRKMKCLSLLDESKKNSKQRNLDEAEMLKFIPSKKIPCAAESVSLTYNKRYGRHLVANSGIKPGEIIIKEKCYVTFPLLNAKYLICSHCLNNAWNGVPCDTCAIVIYCSEKCKKEAWEEYHDIECSILPNFCLMRSMDINRLDIETKASVLRLFIKAVKVEGFDTILRDVNLIYNSTDMQLNGFFQDGIFQSNKFRSFYNLLSSERNPRFVEEDKNIFSKIIDVLFEQLHFKKIIDLNDSNELKKSKCFVENLFLKMIKIIYLNASKEIESQIGITVAPCFSLVNHSCYPNTAAILTKNCEIVLYALRPIKKGQQIFVKTLFIDIYRGMRQLVVQEQYNFTCVCERCAEHWPDEVENSPSAKRKNLSTLQGLASSVGNISKAQMRYYFTNPVQKWPHDKKTVANVQKLLILIDKNFTGHKAFLLSSCFVKYVDLIFYYFSALEPDMPGNC